MRSNTPTPLRKSLTRFKTILTEADRQAMLACQSKPLPTGIRINRLKHKNPHQAMNKLAERYDWQIQPLPFCENAWVITEQPASSPGGTIEHRLGEFYIQDAASIVPVSLFDLPKQPPLILDMAASPGGKTTHLIDRTLDQGLVIANDGSQSRIPALRSVLTNWGSVKQIVTQFPGESFGGWFPEIFDMILLDAPCSMENLRPAPNHPLRETTKDERLRLQERQIQLLESGLQALKVGGQLVYATCSLAPEEDEAVLNAMLKKYPQEIRIQDVSRKVPFNAPGLRAYKGQTYDPGTVRACRLWPHKTGMSGFFCALISKTDSIPTQEGQAPERDFARTELEKIKLPHLNQIHTMLADQYGFELTPFLDTYELVIMQRKDQYFLIPEKILTAFPTLPFSMVGMPLGKIIQDQIEPSHPFIHRFGATFQKGIMTISREETELWVSGRDIRHPISNLQPEGQYVLIKDHQERNLGLGKYLPKRLRNMLPKGLV